MNTTGAMNNQQISIWSFKAIALAFMLSIAILLLGCSVPGRADEPQFVSTSSHDDITAEILIAGLESRYSRVESIVCRYVVRGKDTKAGKELVESLAEKAGDPPPKRSTPWYQRIVWKANLPEKMFLYEIERRDEVTDRLAEKTRLVFDGQRGSELSVSADGQQVGNTRTGVLEAPAFSSLLVSLSGVQVWGYGLPLHRVLTSGESLVLDGNELVEKSQCHRLVATGCKTRSGSVNTVTAHIDVSGGFVVRQLEFNQTKGRVGSREKYVAEKLEKYLLPDGENMFFPVRAKGEFWYPTKREPIIVCRVDVEELGLNQSVRREEFKLEFPAGTMVHDKDKGNSFIAGDGDDRLVAERSDQAIRALQEASATHEKDRAVAPKYSYVPSVIAGVIGVLVLVLVVLVRRS